MQARQCLHLVLMISVQSQLTDVELVDVTDDIDLLKALKSEGGNGIN